MGLHPDLYFAKEFREFWGVFGTHYYDWQGQNSFKVWLQMLLCLGVLCVNTALISKMSISIV